MVDLITVHIKGFRNVVGDVCEVGVVAEFCNIFWIRRRKIVQACDTVASGQKPMGEVATNEAGTAGDEDVLGHVRALNLFWGCCDKVLF